MKLRLKENDQYRIEYENDLVVVKEDGKEIASGMVDDIENMGYDLYDFEFDGEKYVRHYNEHEYTIEKVLFESLNESDDNLIGASISIPFVNNASWKVIGKKENNLIVTADSTKAEDYAFDTFADANIKLLYDGKNLSPMNESLKEESLKESIQVTDKIATTDDEAREDFREAYPKLVSMLEKNGFIYVSNINGRGPFQFPEYDYYDDEDEEYGIYVQMPATVHSGVNSHTYYTFDITYGDIENNPVKVTADEEEDAIKFIRKLLSNKDNLRKSFEDLNEDYDYDNTVDISKENIIECTIPSVEEVENLPRSILEVSDWWWLRDSGYDRHYASGVSNDGDVNSDGYEIRSYRGVRPLLITNLKSESLQLYDTCRILDVDWYYIGSGKFLSKYIQFYPIFDKKSNNYQKSEAKRQLDKWFKDKIKTLDESLKESKLARVRVSPSTTFSLMEHEGSSDSPYRENFNVICNFYASDESDADHQLDLAKSKYPDYFEGRDIYLSYTEDNYREGKEVYSSLEAFMSRIPAPTSEEIPYHAESFNKLRKFKLLKEANSTKKLFKYSGWIYHDGARYKEVSNQYVRAFSWDQARVLICRRFGGNDFRNYDIVDQGLTEVEYTPKTKPIDENPAPKVPEKKVCPECGTQLTDGGYCPQCDDGEEDL